jgi:hypothetical protein
MRYWRILMYRCAPLGTANDARNRAAKQCENGLLPQLGRVCTALQVDT